LSEKKIPSGRTVGNHKSGKWRGPTIFCSGESPDRLLKEGGGRFRGNLCKKRVPTICPILGSGPE